MNFHLTEQQEMLRALTRAFAEGEIAPIARQIDATEEIPESLRKKLRDNNFFALLSTLRYSHESILSNIDFRFSTTSYTSSLYSELKSTGLVSLVYTCPQLLHFTTLASAWPGSGLNT